MLTLIFVFVFLAVWFALYILAIRPKLAAFRAPLVFLRNSPRWRLVGARGSPCS